jgi:hypothetical protein
MTEGKRNDGGTKITERRAGAAICGNPGSVLLLVIVRKHMII